MDNKSENNSASNQNELDLGLNAVEPVTPKKSFTPDSSSFLNKFFGKKETHQANPFAARKEPTFGTATPQTSTTAQTVNYSTDGVFNQPAQAVSKQAVEEAKQQVQDIKENVENTVNSVEANAESAVESAQEVIEETVEQVNNAAEEPIIANKPNMKNPENWAVMQKLPQKHRRLFIAIAGALAVLVALVLLKPSSDTVEDFQAGNNGNNMPIEFQSLDPNQPVENADAANTVQPAETQTADAHQPTGAVANPVESTAAVTPAQNTNATQSAIQPTVQQPVATPASQAQIPAKSEPAVDNKVVQQEQAAREQQAKAAAEKARQEQLAREQAQAKARAEKAKAEQLAKIKAASEKAKAEKARAQAALNGAPVSEAKPAAKTSGGASKTLIVPASTSLFQVFRSNGLDIRDVNAMTKANGVGNSLSSFKAGDKVQVSTNSEGRVSSMRLPSGGVFTRQADGSYKFSK